MSALAELGIHLRHERDGKYRIACPQCAKATRPSSVGADPRRLVHLPVLQVRMIGQQPW